MKSNKMSLDVKIFLIICIVGTFVIVSFLIMPKKATSKYPGGAFCIVNQNDIKTIETYKKFKTFYAIKIQDKDKYFLETHEDTYSGKYTIDKNKFDSIHEGSYYWFYIKFSKPGDESSGSIENVYTNNPLQ